MDNLPNLQRSVGKFFETRKKSQKIRNQKQQQQHQQDKVKDTNVNVMDKCSNVTTTKIKTTTTKTTTTTTTTTTKTKTTTTTTTTTINKSTGAIKKQPIATTTTTTTTKNNNNNIHLNINANDGTTTSTTTITTCTSTSTATTTSNSRLKFFQRNNSNKGNNTISVDIDEQQQQQQPQLQQQQQKSIKNENALVERFRRLQLTKNINYNIKQHSLELQQSVDYIDTPLLTTTTTSRPSHYALKQLRSLDAGINSGHMNVSFSGSNNNSNSSLIGLVAAGSPDEPTPPEFGYQHLCGSSVATTNSNTSLESCSYVDFGDIKPTTTTTTNTTTTIATPATTIINSITKNDKKNITTTSSVCYWAWQQTIATVVTTTANNNYHNNNAKTLGKTTTTSTVAPTMGNDMSINTFAHATINIPKTTTITTTTTTTTTSSSNNVENTTKKRGRRSPLLKMPVIKQLSNAQIIGGIGVDDQQLLVDITPTTNIIKNISNNNSQGSKPPSRSGSASKLMNFLFKSSNESNKSLQGQSNEGFTASSHGSSSGEWEYLGISSTSAGRMEIESLPEEVQIQYDDYPYHYEHQGHMHMQPPQLQQQHLLHTDEAGRFFQYTLSSPTNPFIPEIVAHSYHNSSTNNSHDNSIDMDMDIPTNLGCIMHTRSQLPTPAYSRAGSQESTHSDGATGTLSDNVNTSNNSMVGGRQRRKLFSLHSPRFFQHQHQSEPNNVQQQQQPITATTSTTTSTTTTLTDQNSFMRSLNPFSNSRRASSHGTSPKRKQQISSTVSTPASIPTMDMQAKREEFLRATMKICLVVSPPNNKLQVYCNKSINH